MEHGSFIIHFGIMMEIVIKLDLEWSGTNKLSFCSNSVDALDILNNEVSINVPLSCESITSTGTISNGTNSLTCDRVVV